MSKPLQILMIALLPLGCASAVERIAAPAAATVDVADVQDVRLESPIVVGDLWSVTPVIVDFDEAEVERWRLPELPSMKVATYINPSDSAAGWANAVVVDLWDDESSLLLDKRGLVLDVVLPVEAPPVPPSDAVSSVSELTVEDLRRLQEQARHAKIWPDSVVLLRLVDADSDGDGALTAEDAARVVAVDLDTGERAALTPRGENAVRQQVIDRRRRPYVLVTTVVEVEGLPPQRRYYEIMIDDRLTSGDGDIRALTPNELVEEALRRAGVGVSSGGGS